MKIRKLSTAEFHAGAGISYSSIFPWGGTAPAPFHSSWYRLVPGQTSKRHNHYESEVLFIWSGTGSIRVDGDEVSVAPGDVVYLPALDDHALTNTHARDDLTMLSVYWGDAGVLAAQERDRAAHAKPRPKRVLVTATPPTPNGDLHLGHLSGPYLAADIHRNYLRARGVQVSYLSGADSNQTYVPVKGRKLGRGAAETAKHFGDLMESTLRGAEMPPDLFARPATSRHHDVMVRDFLMTLHARGHLIERDAPSLHCDTCNVYVYEAYVGGTCPHCHARTGGNACEDCGRPNDCADIQNPRCTLCGSTPRVTSTRRLYFPMARFAAQLREYVARTDMSPHLRVLCDQMLAAGLPEICVSHISDWGLPVPIPGYEKQRVYVWVEMAAGYLAATRELADRGGEHHDLSEVWRDRECQVVQFFGFDNGYFHALLFPALFFAFDEALRPPSVFVVNEFYLLDGHKFSTSQDHAVWGQDILATTPPDHVRYFLAKTAPERERTNFTREAFDRAIRDELGRWRTWLEALATRIVTRYEGRAPEPGPFAAADQAFYGQICALVGDVATAFEARSYSSQRAVQALDELVRAAHRFGAEAAHWFHSPDRRDEARTAVSLELVAAHALAVAAQPILPSFGRRLHELLGYPDPALRWEDAPTFVPVGQVVGALGDAVAR